MQSIIVKTQTEKEIAQKVLNALPFEPVFEVSIQEHKSKRSLAQNRLYWRWLSEISEQATTKDGEYLSVDKWHYLCALKFLGMDTIKDDGKIFAIPTKSTTKLTVSEFSYYLMEIETEFVARGVKLTFPDDYNLIMGVK